MLKNIKQFIVKNNKTVLVSLAMALLLACFAFVFGFQNTQSHNRETLQELSVNQTTSNLSVDSYPANDLVLNYTSETKPSKRISSTAATPGTSATNWLVYKWNNGVWETASAPTFVGGSKFYFENESQDADGYAYIKASIPNNGEYKFYPKNISFGRSFAGYSIGIKKGTSESLRYGAVLSSGIWTIYQGDSIVEPEIYMESIMGKTEFSDGYQIYIRKYEEYLTKDVRLWYYDSNDAGAYETVSINMRGDPSTGDPISLPTSSKTYENKVFGAWSVDYYDIYQLKTASNLTNYQHNSGTAIDSSPTTPSGTIIIDNTDAGVYLELNYDRFISSDQSYNNHPYYYIISIKGYIDDNLTNLMGPIFNKGLIYTKWSNLYVLTIDNTAANQVGKLNSANVPLSGAYHYDGSKLDGGNNVEFKIQDSTAYAYPFQLNTYNDQGVTKGYAFMTSADFNSSNYAAARMQSGNKYYYVYNYGYELSGWKIYFESNNNYYYLNNNWKFVKKEENSEIEIVSLSNLIDTNSDTEKLSLIAENTDNYIQSNVNISTIVMKPVWSEVNVKIHYSRTINNEDRSISYIVKYWSDIYYSNSNSFPQEYAKNFAYYLTNENNNNQELSNKNEVLTDNQAKNIIAFNLKTFTEDLSKPVYKYRLDEQKKFDYVNLSANQFTYSDNTYTLAVTPVLLDNIYKVSLSVSSTYSTETLVNADTDYVFSTDSFSENQYNWNSQNLNIGFVDLKTYLDAQQHQDETTEDYIKSENFAGVITSYVTSIEHYSSTCALKNVLRKVFGSGNTGMYIYLANNQPTGNLPVFEDAYEDLIFWHVVYDSTNLDVTGNYAYKTHAFNTNEEGHLTSIDSYNTIREDNTDTTIWQYEDGRNGGQTSRFLGAYYYRKFYDLSVRTLVENSDDRVGIVTINVVDQTEHRDKNGDYVIVYNKATSPSSYGVYATNDRTYNNISSLDPVSSTIKLYAGCDITINAYDQNSLCYDGWFNYDENDCMIGYRNVGLNINQNITIGDQNKVTAAEIAGKNLSTGTQILVNANYSPISYTLTFNLPEINSGNFDFINNGGTTKNKTTYVLEGFNVHGGNKVYSIVFNANVGFEFKETETIVYQPGLNVQENFADASELDSQTYVLTFNSRWLKDYFYTQVALDYPNDAEQDLGTLFINTKEIEFDYKIKLYDSTNETPYFAEVYVDKVSLNQKTNGILSGNGELPNVELDNSKGSYLVKYNDVYYALINSRLYFTGNPNSTNGNYNTNYTFLLNAQPETNYPLTSALIGKMLGRSNGLIVPNDERTLYIRLEVREILDLTIKVVKANDNDTNSTTRVVTVSNEFDGNVANHNNDISVEVESGATALEGAYASASGLSYFGKSNIITLNYDALRYSGVEYYLNELDEGAKLDENVFTTEEDVVLFVKFIPKSLDVNISYLIDSSSPQSLINPSDFVNFISESNLKAKSYYIGNVLNLEIKLLNDDYNLSAIINEATFENLNYSSEDSNGNVIYAGQYTVTDRDYDFSNIHIVVKLTKKLNSGVRFEYRLYDASEREDYDNLGFGTYTVLVDGVAQTLEENGSLNVIANRKLEVNVGGIKAGYYFYGWKKAGTSTLFTEKNGDIITISEAFEPNPNHGEEYFIFVKKTKINVTIPEKENVSVKAKGAVATTDTDNGKVGLNGLYVGKTVEFVYENLQDEELAYFYYYDYATSGYQAVKDVNNKAALSLLLTSENLLNLAGIQTGGTTECEVRFAYKVIKKFKLDYSLKNSENLAAENGFSINYKDFGERYIANSTAVSYEKEEDNDYLAFNSGDYILSNKITIYSLIEDNGVYIKQVTQSNETVTGSSIKLVVNPKVAGKYNIALSGNVYNSVYDAVELEFALNQDSIINIEIEPKTFAVDVNETIYNNLTDLENEEPDVELNKNPIVVSDTAFGKNATLIIDRNILKNGETEHRELKTVTITDKDNNKTTIDIEDISTTIVLDGFTFELNNAHLIISYVVDDDISIQLDYITYKLIHGLE